MTAMITLKEKIGYGLGDMASSMFWKLFGSYLMIFYTDVFGLPAAVVGTMFLITRVWDSAFDPIVGSDCRSHTDPLGEISSLSAVSCRSFCTDWYFYFHHSGVE